MNNTLIKLKLQIRIVQLQIQILILRQKLTVPNLKPPTHIVIHHQGGNWSFSQVNNHHRNRWGFRSSLGYYVGYQLMLFKDFTLKRGRADNEEAAHCPGHNKDSIGICVEGDYSKESLDPKLARQLTIIIDKLRAKYNIPKQNVLGDKEGRVISRPTNCPEGLMSFIKAYRK